MMPILTLAGLVKNRTMSLDMAATLAVAAEEQRSMLFVAIPRMAGKSTVMQAALQYAPAGTPFHPLSRASDAGLGILIVGGGGYLLVPEISPACFDDYLWGAGVRQVFDALAGGFSLATALHAAGVDEAFEVITKQNGVPDEQAARLDLVTYIRSIGAWSHPDRRVVAAIYEIDGVRESRPKARMLHHWSEPDDRFEVAEQARRVGALAGGGARYRAEFGSA